MPFHCGEGTRISGEIQKCTGNLPPYAHSIWGGGIGMAYFARVPIPFYTSPVVSLCPPWKWNGISGETQQSLGTLAKCHAPLLTTPTEWHTSVLGAPIWLSAHFQVVKLACFTQLRIKFCQLGENATMFLGLSFYFLVFFARQQWTGLLQESLRNRISRNLPEYNVRSTDEEAFPAMRASNKFLGFRDESEYDLQVLTSEPWTVVCFLTHFGVFSLSFLKLTTSLKIFAAAKWDSWVANTGKDDWVESASCRQGSC